MAAGESHGDKEEEGFCGDRGAAVKILRQGYNESNGLGDTATSPATERENKKRVITYFLTLFYFK